MNGKIVWTASLQSDYEGQIRTLMGYIDPNTDVIVVAGGDGTLMEVVNGLMRRYDAVSTSAQQVLLAQCLQ